MSPLDFLKVLCFSFPIPVENIKNLPLVLRAHEKIWARLVGKSNVASSMYMPSNFVVVLIFFSTGLSFSFAPLCNTKF